MTTFRPTLELLEDRRVMTTASLVNGTLKIYGTSGSETILVKQLNNQITVSGVTGSWAAGLVQGIDVQAYAGNDLIYLNSEIHGGVPIVKPCLVRGGLGNDTAFGGQGNDSLFGEDGDDRLYGNAGHDYLDGGIGADWLYGDADNDWMYGDAGNDWLYGYGGNDHMSGGTGVDRVYGGGGADYLDGSAGADVINGEADYDVGYFDSADVSRLGLESTPSGYGHYGWFDWTIDDVSLRSWARYHYHSGFSVDRREMLDLFARVRADGTVSATEFADLKDFVNVTFMMPAHVHNLAKKVITGDRANGWYQGATLGNLSAGCSASRLEKLVNKWFLGLDRPVAKNSDGTQTYAYRPAAGTLFRDGISYTDIDQGSVGDCYYLAALGTVALRTPNVINDMFIDNGDGTYTVRFYKNDNGTIRKEYVTVDRWLPIEADNDFRFAGTDSYYDADNDGVYEDGEKLKFNSPQNELWVALAEKAYAQVNESGWIGQDGKNSYQGIGWGFAGDSMTHISGKFATEAGSATFSQVVGWWNDGRLITVASESNPACPDVIANHAYAVVGYNATTQKFCLFNPHGIYVDDNDRPAFLEMTWDEIRASFDNWDHSHS